MKKSILTALAILSAVAATGNAQAHPGGWHGGGWHGGGWHGGGWHGGGWHGGGWHGGYGGGWVAPLIVGGAIGAVIADQYAYPYAVPVAPEYHSVVVSAYTDRYNRYCEVHDNFDQYDRFVNRYTTCN